MADRTVCGHMRNLPACAYQWQAGLWMDDNMNKTVLIISTLDTKGEETYYLRDKIESLGLKPLLMDISMRGEGPTRADIVPESVAKAGGSSIEEIRASKERSRITNITIAGASRIAGEFFAEGKLDGVIGIGGSTGSLMATEVMRALPFGVPKLMISSTAALPGLATRYIGTGDIALFQGISCRACCINVCDRKRQITKQTVKHFFRYFDRREDTAFILINDPQLK